MLNHFVIVAANQAPQGGGSAISYGSRLEELSSHCSSGKSITIPNSFLRCLGDLFEVGLKYLFNS